MGTDELGRYDAHPTIADLAMYLHGVSGWSVGSQNRAMVCATRYKIADDVAFISEALAHYDEMGISPTNEVVFKKAQSLKELRLRS